MTPVTRVVPTMKAIFKFQQTVRVPETQRKQKKNTPQSTSFPTTYRNSSEELILIL